MRVSWSFIHKQNRKTLKREKYCVGHDGESETCTPRPVYREQIQKFNHWYFCGNISINKQWCRNTICRRLSIAGKQESDKNYPPDETRTASESVAAAEKWNEETALSLLNLSVWVHFRCSTPVWFEDFLRKSEKLVFDMPVATLRSATASSRFISVVPFQVFALRQET